MLSLLNMNYSRNKTSESNNNNIIKNSDCKNDIRDHSGEGCRHTTKHAKQEATENPEVVCGIHHCAQWLD